MDDPHPAPRLLTRKMPLLLAWPMALLCIHVPSANSACISEELLVTEYQHLFEDDAVRLAFVEAMAERHFEAAKKALGTARFRINAIPAEEYVDLGSAKAAGRAEASARLFNLEPAESRRLIANRMSADDKGAYVECLRSQGAPLTAWVQLEEGVLARVSVLFRPTNEDQEFRRPAMFGFELVSRPAKKFPAQDIQTLLFKRTSSESGLIELSIGTERAILSFPPRQRLVAFSNNTTVSTEIAFAWSTGPRSGPANKDGQACTKPPAGRAFVVGSEKLIPLAGHNIDTEGELVSVAPDKICWKVTVEGGSPTRRLVGRARLSAELVHASDLLKQGSATTGAAIGGGLTSGNRGGGSAPRRWLGEQHDEFRPW